MKTKIKTFSYSVQGTNSHSQIEHHSGMFRDTTNLSINGCMEAVMNNFIANCGWKDCCFNSFVRM